jgi:membrane-associated phospholipid phosphatase
MIEQIIQLDKSAFIAINNGLSIPFLDWLCPILRNQSTWYLLYVVFIYFIIKLYKKASWKILLGIALMILCSDQFSVFVKNTFERLRPCHDLIMRQNLHLLVNSCGGKYGFISSHATNHFAIAVFVSFFFKSYSRILLPVLIFWAFSISFSQVYVGVHYPLDVLVGAVIGSLFGFVFSKYTNKYIHIE